MDHPDLTLSKFMRNFISQNRVHVCTHLSHCLCPLRKYEILRQVRH